MRRTAIFLRLFAVLSLGLWLVGTAAVTVRAQDEGTPPADETPTEPAGEASALQGTLIIAIYTCTTGPENTVGGVFLPGDFTPDDSCTEGGTAGVTIDGAAAQEVAAGDQLTLDEGDHTVDETSINAPVTATISAAEPTTVAIVFYDVAAAAATGSIAIIKHICPESVTDQTSFDALGDFYAKELHCPVITLPGDTGPDGSINGNDPNKPLSFDFTVAFTDNGNDIANGIDTATFNPTQVCESDLGFDINGDPNDDICLDQSSYGYADVVQGSVTVTESTPPDGYGFGAVEFVPNSGEDATFVSAGADTSEIALDTTGVDSVTLHVFNFVKPATNRINIVKHQCDSDIVSQDDFDALGNYYAKLLACPTILRGGDNGPDGAITGGHRTFAFSVVGADSQTQTIDNATFVPAKVCESDLNQDIDGNPNNDLCLDASYYQFDNVQQGQGVTVTETKSPKGYAYGAVEFTPDSGDDAALVNATADGKITLDTTNDGEVTLQVFNFAKPTAEPTPTPTEEPSAPVGTLVILKFYCLGDDTHTEIDPLGPGEEVNLDDFIDDTCYAGPADFDIQAFGTDDLGTYSTSDDGQLVVNDLPATNDQTGQHVITELYSEESAGFDIHADTVTRIVVLNYEPDPYAADTSSTDGQDNTDAGDVTSGDDLPDTGIGAMRGGPVDGGAVLMFGAMGLLLLAGAATLRKRAF